MRFVTYKARPSNMELLVSVLQSWMQSNRVSHLLHCMQFIAVVCCKIDWEDVTNNIRINTFKIILLPLPSHLHYITLILLMMPLSHSSFLIIGTATTGHSTMELTLTAPLIMYSSANASLFVFSVQKLNQKLKSSCKST